MTATAEEILEFDMADLGAEDGDFNARPAPLPEGQNYIIALGLGRNGISERTYHSVKGDENSPLKAFYTLDLLGRVVGSETGDVSIAGYENFVSIRDQQGKEFSTFVPAGKTISGLLHVAKLLELSTKDYGNFREFLDAVERRLKTTPQPQVIGAKLQWQWSMKVEGVEDKNGRAINYKTVKYGMKNAERNTDGTPSPTLYFDKQGNQVAKGTKDAVAVQARAVVQELRPLA